MTCVCCGAEIHRDEVCFVGDQPLCRDCADEETFVCDNCGFRHWNSDNQGDNRYDLCPSCREEYFVTCSECGRLIPNSEAWYADDDDDTPPYCESCYREKVGDALHPYSYKPSPIFYGDGPLYLGVELEVDGAGQSASHARTVLNVINRREEYAYMKTDGSLDDGLELVTHPCTLEEHRTKVPWSDTVAAFREMHYNSHNAGTCGLHVHVNRDALGEHSAAQDETISKILYLFERFWQEILMHFKGMDSHLIMIKLTEKGWKRLNTWNHDKSSPKVQKILGVRTEIRLQKSLS